MEGDVGGSPIFGAWHDVEVDGFCPKRRWPLPDAYRKYTLEPDPTFAIQGRIEWEAWRRRFGQGENRKRTKA
jgi:hypothetical protein